MASYTPRAWLANLWEPKMGRSVASPSLRPLQARPLRPGGAPAGPRPFAPLCKQPLNPVSPHPSPVAPTQPFSQSTSARPSPQTVAFVYWSGAWPQISELTPVMFHITHLSQAQPPNPLFFPLFPFILDFLFIPLPLCTRLL